MNIIAFLATLAAALALAVVFLALVARLNGQDAEDDGEPTILIGPAEPEPLGEQVDVLSIIRKYGD
jgi:hypothetical protein